MDKKEKRKENKEKKPLSVGFLFLVMLFFFLIEEIITIFFPQLFAESVKYGKYGVDIIYEVGAFMVIILILFISKKTYIFGEKGESFGKSLRVGAPFLVLGTFILLVKLSLVKDFNIYNFISLIVLVAFVGAYEELLCRGWLQNSLVKGRENSYGETLVAIVLASLIFGTMHILNVFSGQSLFSTLVQILQATALGFLFGTIYYRTKNIWALMFLHAYWDFAVMINEMNVVKDCTTGTVTKSIAIYSITVSVLLSLCYICLGLYIFRKEKILPIMDEKAKVKPNKGYNLLLIILIIGFFGVTNFIRRPKDYENYEICYEYKTKEVGYSEIHYPLYKNYEIGNGEYRYEIVRENKQIVIKNLNTNQSEVLLDSTSLLMVVDEADGYVISLVHIDDDMNYIVSYSDYIKYDNMSDDNSYLKEIKKSFKTYTLPTIKRIGYLTNREDIYNYPFFEGEQNNNFIIDEKGDLYLVEFNYKAKDMIEEAEIIDDDSIRSVDDPFEEDNELEEEIQYSELNEIHMEDVMDQVIEEAVIEGISEE